MPTQPVSWDSCTCRVRLANTITGETVTAKSRRWDCPSCGLDKANRVREMVVTQNVERLWVGTFHQPEEDPNGPHPGGFELCDPDTHLYLHEGPKGRRWLWRRLETCEHCCRWSSRVVKMFRERLRRRYPDAQVLWVKEVKPKSGAFDINLSVSGVPPATRRDRAGRRIKQDWAECGGGHFDLGDAFRGKRSPGAAGRYIGKYLTKLAHRPMARGFRRWGRSAGFAPDVRMIDPREPKPADYVPVAFAFVGWVDVDGVSLIPHGFRREAHHAPT